MAWRPSEAEVQRKDRRAALALERAQAATKHSRRAQHAVEVRVSVLERKVSRLERLADAYSRAAAPPPSSHQ